nr:uncharacterized protein LOC129467514 [Symphalangus syndactylus]
MPEQDKDPRVQGFDDHRRVPEVTGDARSAFRPLRDNGGLSPFVPRPGPLQRVLHAQRSEVGHTQRSQTSCTSSCTKRNAISSSYSSTGGFPWLKRRRGPASSHCQPTLSSSKKGSEDRPQAVSSGHTQCAPGQTLAPRNGSPRSQASRPRGRNALQVEAKAISDCRPSRPSYTSCSLATGASGLPSVSKAPSMDAQQEGHKPQDGLGLVAPLASAAGAPSTAPVFGMQHRPPGSLLFVSSFPLPPTFFYFWDSAQVLWLIATPFGSSFPLPPTFFYFWASAQVLWLIAAPFPAASMDGSISGASSSPPPTPMEIDSSEADGARHSVRRNPLKRKANWKPFQCMPLSPHWLASLYRENLGYARLCLSADHHEAALFCSEVTSNPILCPVFWQLLWGRSCLGQPMHQSKDCFFRRRSFFQGSTSREECQAHGPAVRLPSELRAQQELPTDTRGTHSSHLGSGRQTEPHWGRDGLQPQEVQQHLDLPSQSGEEESGSEGSSQLLGSAAPGKQQQEEPLEQLLMGRAALGQLLPPPPPQGSPRQRRALDMIFPGHESGDSWRVLVLSAVAELEDALELGAHSTGLLWYLCHEIKGSITRKEHRACRITENLLSVILTPLMPSVQVLYLSRKRPPASPYRQQPLAKLVARRGRSEPTSRELKHPTDPHCSQERLPGHSVPLIPVWAQAEDLPPCLPSGISKPVLCAPNSRASSSSATALSTRTLCGAQEQEVTPLGPATPGCPQTRDQGRPGPLQRVLHAQRSEVGHTQRSQTSCTSSCTKRNAISSSYSSTGGFPWLKRRRGPASSHCQPTLSSSKKGSEDRPQAVSSGHTQCAPGQTLAPRNGSPRSQASRPRGRNALQVEAKAISDCRPSRPSYTSCSLATGASGLPSVSKAPSMDAQQEGHKPQDGLGLVAPLASAAGAPSTAPVFGMQHRPPGSLLFVSSFPLPPTFFYFWDSAQVLWLIATPFGSSFPLPPTFFYFWASAQVLWLIAAPFPAASMDGSISGASSSPPPTPMEIDSSEADGARHSVRRNPLKRKANW